MFMDGNVRWFFLGKVIIISFIFFLFLEYGVCFVYGIELLVLGVRVLFMISDIFLIIAFIRYGILFF